MPANVKFVDENLHLLWFSVVVLTILRLFVLSDFLINPQKCPRKLIYMLILIVLLVLREKLWVYKNIAKNKKVLKFYKYGTVKVHHKNGGFY